MKRCSSVTILLVILFFPCLSLLARDDRQLRTDGILHRLRKKIEKPYTTWTLFDRAGKQYRFDGKHLSTFLYDDNANLSIPSTDEAPFVEARARAFEKQGLHDLAEELYAALESMDGRYFSVTPDVAAIARRSGRPGSQPVVLVHEDLLHIISEEIGFHLRLPVDRTDPFRLLRESREKGRYRTGYVLRLFSRQRQCLIFFDKFLKITSSPDVGSYSVFADLRRGFDWQRKRRTNFTRRCQNGVCSVEFMEKGFKKGWEEILFVRSNSAFVLAVSPSGDDNRIYLRRVLDQMRTGRLK